MLIGLTYDLRQEYLAMGFSEQQVAEFDSPHTVEAIEQSLQRLGYATERIGHLRSLVQGLGQGHRWDLVFNIAEGIGGYGREAQVPALLEAYGIPCTFSDPLTLCLSLHKGMAKRVIRDLGLPTPNFAVLESPDQAQGLELTYPLFAKPVAEGTGLGISPASRVEDPGQLEQVCAQLLARHGQPVLVEEFLPGRELTVGLMGSGAKAKVIGVMEVSLRPGAEEEVYSYHNKENCEQLVTYRRVKGRLALQAGELALAVWQGLGCRDAGRVDLRCDGQGHPSFLEVNPLAGLHPEHSDLPILCGLVGRDYNWLIEGIMRSALARCPGVGKGRPSAAGGGR